MTNITENQLLGAIVRHKGFAKGDIYGTYKITQADEKGVVVEYLSTARKTICHTNMGSVSTILDWLNKGDWLLESLLVPEFSVFN